jgi:signal transduction histidine kinase
MTALSNLTDTGLEVVDLENDPEFTQRSLHPRSPALQIEGLQRLAKAFVTAPESILQELVNVAVDICGADSAGISIEQDNATDTDYYQWIATAGVYSPFMGAILPRYPSACSLCLERGKPQVFRVSERFFEIMGIQAAIVTDGILLPWQTEETRGTIWIMAHGRTRAFDGDDCRMMQALASFAAMGVHQQRQQKRLMEQAGIAAAIAMANDLAHQINNPLQSLVNLVYIETEAGRGGSAHELAVEMAAPLQRLSSLVSQLLALPSRPA